MIYMRDLKNPNGEITFVSNWIWLVLIVTYTGVGVTCLTIHGGFWIARTIVLMDILMFILQFIMYNAVNAY
jgi:hypothetical protein